MNFQNWKVYSCSLGIQAMHLCHFQEFNPELYSAIGNVLLKSYLKSGTPISMLQAFLSLFTKGFCEDEDNGCILAIKDFDKRAAQLKTCIKGTFLHIIPGDPTNFKS